MEYLSLYWGKYKVTVAKKKAQQEKEDFPSFRQQLCFQLIESVNLVSTRPWYLVNSVTEDKLLFHMYLLQFYNVFMHYKKYLAPT